MSEDGDVDVESAEDIDVPDIGVEATATTSNGAMYRGGSHDKRAHHNALERRRRDHIKDSFHGLRDCIPSLVGEKVSRAHILNKATEYIRHMQKGGSMREDDICDLAGKNEILEEQVRGLDEARACGSAFSAEDLLQGIAVKVQARQAQEIILQQLQTKSSNKPPKQPSNKTKPVSAPSERPTPPQSAATTKNTPTSASSQLPIPSSINLLANNLKSTQSLLSVLQKNLSPNISLPSSIKSLAARVLASPLIRAAQKTTQAASLPRGIVTATTVTKGGNLPSPSHTATPTSSTKSSGQATGTNNITQSAESALELSAESIPVEIVSKPTNQLDAGILGLSPFGAHGAGVQSSPSLLTSQLLEAHSLLQQQGVATTLPASTLELVNAQEISVDDSPVPLVPPSALGSAQGGLNIPPDLLAQVSSLFNLSMSPSSPPPPASSAPLPVGDGGNRILTPQDSSQNRSLATTSSTSKRLGEHEAPPSKMPRLEH